MASLNQVQSMRTLRVLEAAAFLCTISSALPAQGWIDPVRPPSGPQVLNGAVERLRRRVVPQQRADAERGDVSLPAPRRRRLLELLTLAGGPGAARRSDGRGAGPRHL